MRCRLLGCVLLLFAGGLCADETAVPKIEFSVLEHDFGEIAQGDKPSFDFVLKNTGKADLTIDRVQTSCGCTAAVSGKKLVPPGDEGMISVTFNSAGRQGAFDKAIHVYTNDPAKPDVQLHIRGAIITPFKADPPFIGLGRIPAGKPLTRELRVSRGGFDHDVEIVNIEHGQWISTEAVGSVVKKEEAVLIKINVLETAPVGPLNDQIRIIFKDPAARPLTVSLSGIVEGPIRVIPARLNFFVNKPLEELTPQVIRLAENGTESFEIKQLEFDSKIIFAEFTAVEPGKRYEVQVKLTTVSGEKFFKTQLKIHTSDPVMSVIEVPIQVWISGK